MLLNLLQHIRIHHICINFTNNRSIDRWTKNHPLEQVIGDPSKPVLKRKRHQTDAEVCMYALTVSTIELKNIKEAMLDHSWIESMQISLTSSNALMFRNLSNVLLKDSGFELIAYADTDHAGCNDDCKSTSGGIQFLGDKLVSWSSKKKDCTAMSFAKDKYVSLSACCAQVIWMRTQLLDYGFHYHKIPIYRDSKSAIAISYNPVQHSRTKHINIRYHFIKEYVEKGTIELYFVGMEYQLANLFTKALPKERFEFLVHKIETAYVPTVYLQQFWRTVSKVPDTEDTIKFLLDTEQFIYTVDMLEEDYHSIKDDVPLVSVYTTGNISVRGMLVPYVFLTTEIRETNDFKEYETVFIKKKRKQIAGESSSPQQSLKITIKQKQTVKKDYDDSEDRIEPGINKDNLEVVDDDDDKEREKQDDEMGSLEIRNEETQTTIPAPLNSHRKILSSNKKTFQELTDIVSNPITSTSKQPQVKKRISSKYSHLPGALRMDVHASRLYDSRHGKEMYDDAPPKGEKRVKSSKELKSSKSARGSSSKHSRKDSTTYVSKQQSQHQEWDAWEEENVVDEDEVIPEDVTLELISES
ncbi:hypothetical protein Tco_1383128 [Tanacetum coccineum]